MGLIFRWIVEMIYKQLKVIERYINDDYQTIWQIIFISLYIVFILMY
jgi:hypothetical protein